MELPPHRTGTVASGDVELFYRMFGKPGKSPVLIFHGANYYDSADWVHVAAALAGDRQVAAWDTRGFGRSGWSRSKDYSDDQQMADIDVLVDHFDWDRFIPMGHSMGGGRSILYASRFPDRVAALIVVDHRPGKGGGVAATLERNIGRKPVVYPSIEAAQEKMSRDINTPAGSPARERLMEILRKVDGGYTYPRDPDFQNQVPIGGEGGKAKIVVDDTWRELSRVTVPILIVRATRSDRYTLPAIQRVKTEFPHIKMVDVESGHDVAGGAPEQLIAAARAFLAVNG